VTLRREPTWGGGVAAAPVPAESNGAPQATGGRPAPGSGNAASDAAATSIESLEAEVYASRDVHGDARAQLRRTLARARSSMSEAGYRHAHELARDSVLLSVDECIQGARAMEWEPLPRPEFSLATIEAAVAEQERAG
jgi:hypothetical protein